jgi:Zn-finger nucleic acid-binding protein
MQCPVCHIALNLTERQGVEIDYCPQCRGVWLDRGELDKIIARAAAEPPSGFFAGRPRRDDDREYDLDKGRRRKSFLHDLFDFD